MELSARLPLETILREPNLAAHLSAEDQATIARWVWDEWQIDRGSRADWEDQMKFGLDLALQVAEQKSFPWPGAANVKFPLVTIAALQYQARAYPALVPNGDLVRVNVYGDDPDGILEDQGRRIAKHMSYQLLEEDKDWESEEDTSLLCQAIVGSAFKKTFFSSRSGHNDSEHVFAKDLYISYFAKSLEDSPRITQVLYFSRNDLEERRRSGLFLEWDIEPAAAKPAVQAPDILDEAADSQQGTSMPANDPAQPFKILEQHRWLDLDGDGYQEPYVVFVREDTQALLRIVARFKETSVKKTAKGEIYCIEADHYFTQRVFIPSPDGGIYGLGFGSLLSPLNESINSSINLLLDAGTVANTAGGLLGRGVKFKSGEATFKPWEWKRVDSTGDDLRKGVFPLPVREPSMVVFSLLKLLIDYGERVAMATDPQVGVPTGQNTPAETSRNMIAEGQRVFSAIYKRTRRALKEEFRKLYCLNRVFLKDSQSFVLDGNEGSSKIFRADYSLDEKVIVPAADPEMVTDAEKLQRAMVLTQRAMQVPGYNRYEVEKVFLRSIRAGDIDKIFPDPKGPNAVPPPPNPKIAVEMMKLEGAKLKMQFDLQVKMAKLMQDAELNQAKIKKLEAEAMKAAAEADGVETGHKIAAFEAMIGAARAKQEGIFDSMNMLKEMHQSLAEIAQHGDQGGVSGMAKQHGDQGGVQVPPGPAGASQGVMG